MRAMLISSLFLFTACAPLRAGSPPLVLGHGALDLRVQAVESPRCRTLNAQRSNWGAAGKVSGAVAGACVAGGGIYAASSRDGLSQGEALSLASCAVVAGGVVLLSASKAEDLAQTWAGECATADLLR